MSLVDSHCHLNYEGLAERQDEVLANARERGVAGFLNISTRQAEWNDVISVAEAVGVTDETAMAKSRMQPHNVASTRSIRAASVLRSAHGACSSM